MSITSSAVLVEMNLSVWTANKLDRKVTSELLTANNAVAGAAQVRKNLMAGTTARKDIADYAAGCRLWHNTRTLPWADKGVRMLPTSLFMEYKMEANKRRDTFNMMVTTFLKQYPQLVLIANTYMQGLFDKDDYPSVDAIRELFGFRLVFSPVPEAGDFRLDVPQKDLEEIKGDYEESFNTRLADAMKEPWNRLHKMLTGMSDKLEDSAGGEDAPKKRYHDSLITNADDMCELLKHLNITNDPKLEQARKDLKASIAGVSVETLKDSASARDSLKRNVDAVLKQFEW